jgi:hypothetical protein
LKSRGGFKPFEFQPSHTLNPCEGRNSLPMGKVYCPPVCVANDHIVSIGMSTRDVKSILRTGLSGLFGSSG